MPRFPGDASLLNAFVVACPAHDRPKPFVRDASAMANLEAELPGALPPLFGKMLAHYKWGEIDLDNLLLLPNHAASDFAPWLGVVKEDRALWDGLIPAGLIPFARGPYHTYHSYDPVCFDLRQRQSDGDCRIVQLNHEEILCNYRLREVATLAPTFRELIIAAIGKKGTES